MEKLRFKGSEAVYPGTLMEISDSKIVLNFYTGIPASFDASVIEVLDESGAAVKTLRGFITAYQIQGTRVILSNDGAVVPVDSGADTDAETALENAKAAKLSEISETCEQVIHYGIDVNGAHYSLTDKDQTNLFGKQAQLSAGATQAEYHADGEPCRYFSADEMTAIITAAMAYVTYHTTYCNALNMWIKSAESLEEVQSIYYGCAIPEAYQSVVLVDMMAQMAGGSDETVS